MTTDPDLLSSSCYFPLRADFSWALWMCIPNSVWKLNIQCPTGTIFQMYINAMGINKIHSFLNNKKIHDSFLLLSFCICIPNRFLKHKLSHGSHWKILKWLWKVSEKAMAPHSSTLAWKIPWMEEPGRLQSMGSLRVGYNWATSLSLFTFMYWRRQWQPTPVFLPGESQGRGSLVGCRLWGRTESDTTEAT